MFVVLPGCGTVVVDDFASATVFGYPTSGIHDPAESYSVNLLNCETELQPTLVTEESGTAGTFFNTVSGEFPVAAGWSYTSATNDLSNGSIRIKTYDAQGTPTRVGAEVHVIYQPGTSDPSTSIHWIQVISTNHSLKPPAGHGPSANYVDIPNAATTPYYDDGYAAGSGNCSSNCDLYDFPGRVDTSLDHDWLATTFLVQGPAVGAGPGAITFLTPGFQWGWVNNCELLIAFPGWIFFKERPILFVISDSLEPGGTTTLRTQTPGRMILMKGETQVPVELLEAEFTLAIGKQIDQGGYYPFTVTAGRLQFGAYVFADRQVGESTSEVREGSGYIHWETGEASIQFATTFRSIEQRDVPMLFTGTAQIDREEGTFLLQVDTKGIEQIDKQPGNEE
ncbi:MAG: hypothetical protein O6922_06015 [Chloroflexi bacterium]|nr:hypothetical protein [Chloroflexota bacterium]